MHNQFKTQKFKHLMLAMGPRDLNSAPYSPVHCSSHSITSFQSSELTELPVVENSQLFAQRTVHPPWLVPGDRGVEGGGGVILETARHPPRLQCVQCGVGEGARWGRVSEATMSTTSWAPHSLGQGFSLGLSPTPCARATHPCAPGKGRG